MFSSHAPDSSARAAARPSILAVDVGTSTMKGGLIDTEGNLLAVERITLADSGSARFDRWSPAAWEEAFGAICRSLQTADGRWKIEAAAVSGNGPTLVPIDRQGEAMERAYLWLDGRERPLSGEPSFFLPKAAWIAAERPEEYEATDFYLGCPEYISYLLSGEAAGFTPSREFAPYMWNREGCSAYGLEAEKFPPLVKTGTVLGRVNDRGARLSGLQRGVPVVAGGSDFLLSLLGTGAVYPGRTCDRAGTSEGINCCSSRPVRDERIRCLPHAVEGYYNAAGILSSSGRIFEWFRRISGQRNREYTEMLEEIRKLGGNEGAPYFFPSLHRGAVWEFSGGVFAGLEAEHGEAEMGRAVVNSIGFGIRDLVETLESHGCSLETLRVSGGQGRNETWNRMKADITGKPVEVPEVIDAELLGCAVVCHTALGRAGSVQESAEELVRILARYEPDPFAHAEYGRAYGRYQEIRERIVELFSGVTLEKGI
jgi:xylulokinase